MIRIDALWLAAAPTDMRAGIDRLLAQIILLFGEARPHTAYLFVNARASRIKLLVHDGFGIWLATRRLNQGQFLWPKGGNTVSLSLTRTQFDALILGLPWQRLSDGGILRIL